MPTQPPTTAGKLSDLARHVVIPSGLVSTGWPAVRDKSLELGIRFDPWQDGAGRIILSKRADGLYATSVGGVVISIPRQVGKTFLVGSIVFALCLLFPGLTVIWTAHRLRTAGETFASMQALTRRRKIAPHVDKVVLGSGDEEIRFRNGSRILFGARERGFGRGFTLVDVLVFDEAQILTENAIDDMVPATNQAPNPLLLFTGTPPKLSDPGEVFTAKREKALSGSSEDMAYIEFSADEDANPDDRKQWAKANPSYPKRTPAQAILRMRENLTDESFMREALGIWAPVNVGLAVDPARWASLVGPTPERGSDTVFALDVAPDHSTATVAAGWTLPDGTKWLQVADHRAGVEWVVDRVAELQAKWHAPLIVEKTGTAAFLLPKLENTHEVARRFYADACSTLDADVTARAFRHGNQPELNATVSVARWSTSGEAAHRVLSRKDPRVSPLVAAALVLHGLTAGNRPSVYEERGMVSL